MVFDQAQSPRLGQRTPVESTYVRMFAGGEIPEAAWPGQLIYRSDDQILQIFNGDAWEDVTGGELGQLTFVGPTPPISQHVGDVWYNTADGNRMYLSMSVGADAIAAGEWELVSAAAPPLVPGTHIYHQDTPPGPTDTPPPHNNDFWYETPDNKQYYYNSIAPGTHWIFVQDLGIPAAIKSAVTEYAVNSSETVAPTTGWSTTTPTRAPGTFVWFRTTTTKNDNTSSTTNPALLTGNTGATGPQGSSGAQGVPGPPGADGTPVYTWVKYADTPTTGMTDDPTGKAYLGLAYNKPTPVESNLFGDYQWSLIQGADGADGDPGVPGPPGADGQPTYTWIKYGTSATGAGINDSPVGMTYMGIAYNKTTPVESTNPALYEWSQIQGPQGPQGPTGSQGIQGPAGANGQILYTWLKYADTPTSGMSDLPAGKVYMGISYNHTSSTESNLYTDYDWSLIQGPQGNTGVQGPPGTNGQPTYTWIKYATSAAGAGLTDTPGTNPYIGFAYNKTTATESSIPTDYEWSLIQGPQGPTGSQGVQGPVGPNGQATYTWIKYADTPTTGMTDTPGTKPYLGIAYNKTTPVESSLYSDYEWNLTTGPQGSQGIQGPIGPNGQTTYTWIKYGTSATGAGLQDSPTGMTYMGISYNKTTAVESTLATDYEWSLIQGPQGTSITAVAPYYAQVVTGAAAPAIPSTSVPVAPWVTPEPAYAPGTELYVTNKISYSNATFSYTGVSKSSSYSGLATKTKAFYQGQTTNGIPTATAVGDVWYDTDDSNHPYWASAIGVNTIQVSPTAGWYDAKDPNIDLNTSLSNENQANIEANAGAIDDLNTSLENVSITAVSAQNSADTADGRVSMSDYMPGVDDVLYDQTQLVVDDETGLLTQVVAQVPRANGSIWFVRTRPRQNLCTNPSFEATAVPTVDWAGGNLTNITTVTAAPAVDGTKVAQLTNTAGAVNHYFQWSPPGRQPCVEGQEYTAAAYCKLVSGHGLGLFMNIVWYDTSGVYMGGAAESWGAPVDLIVGGVLTDWERPWVTAEAPAGAGSFVARINSPASNVSDVWQVDAMQVEATAELGRYFDGDSFDCSWDDITQANIDTSTMEGTKITQVYELHDGDWVRKWFTDDTLWFLDASKLVGSLNGEIITDNTLPVDKQMTTQALASETLAAGDLVHIWNNNGIFNLQKACAAPGLNLEVHGFVLDPVPAGTLGKIYHSGYNPFMANLAPGLIWLSSTPGKVAKTPPTAVGSLVQRVGYAPSATVLDFQPVQSIKIT